MFITDFHDLLPPDRSPGPLGRLLPRDLKHRLSVLLLWFFFLAYLGYWARMHWGWLFDTLLQNDDARIWLYPFHRYTLGSPLAADPVALEKLALVPSGLRLLYRCLVPWTGVFAAAKIIQGLCLGIIGYAGWALGRSRRGGLAAGILFVFLMLNTTFIVNRMAGGLARGFAFPLLALWVAGAFSRRERLRWVALMLSALAYPTALVLLLGCETLTVLWDNARKTGKTARLRLLRAGLLVGVSMAMIIPYTLGTRELGRPFTLQDAMREPAFYAGGRMPELPFPGIAQAREKLAAYPIYVTLPAALTALGVFLLLARFVLPVEFLACLAAACGLYSLSRFFAFRLFLPERFFEYAGPVLCLMLGLGLLRLLGARLKGAKKAVLRNLSVCGFIAASFFLFPKSIRPENGMTIEGRSHARLYAFMRSLPSDVIVACHPDDGNDLPFWAGRSTLVNRENLLPFAVEFWDFQKTRAQDTLSALYSVRRGAALAFSEKYRVTHFLLNEGRYGAGFKEAASLFEPFGSYVRGIVAPLKRADLALANVPAQAVVFRDAPFLVVDVKRLRDSWAVK